MKHIIGDYYASECGRIYNKKRNLYKAPWMTKTGYYKVTICIDSKSKTHLVHRLIAAAYHGKSDLTVDHIDNDKTNNRPENLQYLSQTENVKKSVKQKLNPTGERCANSKLTNEQAKHIRESNDSIVSLSKKYCIDYTNIWRIKKGLSYKESI